MSSCDNFVEQLWRKGKCANCFQSREKHQNAASTHEEAGSATANYKPIRAATLPRSQRNQNFKASIAENAKDLFKQEQVKEGNDLRNGANDIKPIAPCTTIENTKDCSGVNEAGKKAQDSKPSVANKPKPAPRPRPTPSSRAVEFGCSLKSLQESSADVISGTIPLEGTLGNSHSGPQCNANSSENSEDPVLSILDHDKESEETNKLNIEAVCKAVAHEKDATDVGDTRNDMERRHVNDSDRASSSKETVVVDSVQTETGLLPCKNVDGDESDVEEYVPMKSNIALFATESLHNEPHETDVSEVNLDLRERGSSDNRAINACDSQTDDENSSGVLEFSNPLCVITNDMGDTNKLPTQESGGCDKLNDNHNKITSIKSSTAEPFYVNRPSSSSSDSTVSSSHDSGYENTRKSTRSYSSHSASGNGNDVSTHVLKPDQVSLAGKSVACSETKHCEFNIESSGTSNSSWGSSTWDSCSTSDFHENSSESMLAVKAARRFNTADNKPPSEVLIFHTAQSVTTGETPAYVNTTLKPFTKPYRVVDISSGVSDPTMENQNDAPPLPPKEKDLRKDRAEVLNHVYLEPAEETKGIPDQDLPKDKKDVSVVSVAKVSTAPSLSSKQSSSNVTDNSAAVRRAPAPRPRSRVPSQFGTLPKPAPRTSRILNDTPVKVDTKAQKGASPPVGKLHCDLN